MSTRFYNDDNPSKILLMLANLGSAVIFLLKILAHLGNLKLHQEDIFHQIWKITLHSLGIIALSGFFVGSIMAIQFSLQLKEFAALSLLGGLATSGTIRELGPLLIAFMLSGRVGAYTTSELGTMKVTDQIDAIRCLGADPIKEIIFPRFIGIICASFFLLIFGVFTSIFGGMTAAALLLQLSPQEYLREIPRFLNLYSILLSLFKVFVFSFCLAWISTYIGYHTEGGALGVGKNVVKTAALSLSVIVFADWVTSLVSESIQLLFS
ncbi:MAG: ABC transporter permease [Bdellovibrionaceae bacterium]|nr:ABC transporter permease [Pseudobdellovibrionaceae bacterium]MDW8189845.1 ABC transporter permease [Pseudobdellovibrionaceae bacterium]